MFKIIKMGIMVNYAWAVWEALSQIAMELGLSCQEIISDYRLMQEVLVIAVGITANAFCIWGSVALCVMIMRHILVWCADEIDKS